MSGGAGFTWTRRAVLAFTLLTIAAMLAYPGGTYRDAAPDHYLFLRNFLSDLGMPATWSGRPNAPSAALFISAELIIAAGLVAFLRGILALSRERTPGWTKAAAVAAAVAALAIVAAAATPADRFFQLHVQSALLVFRALFLTCLFLAIAIWRDGRFRRGATATSIAAALILGAYLILLEWGPRARTDYGLFVQATGQKVAVVALLAWFFVLSGDAARVQREREASRPFPDPV